MSNRPCEDSYVLEEEISDGELTDLLAEVDESASTSSRLRPSTMSRPGSSTERRHSQRIQSRASSDPDPRPMSSWVCSTSHADRLWVQYVIHRDGFSLWGFEIFRNSRKCYWTVLWAVRDEQVFLYPPPKKKKNRWCALLQIAATNNFTQVSSFWIHWNRSNKPCVHWDKANAVITIPNFTLNSLRSEKVCEPCVSYQKS